MNYLIDTHIFLWLMAGDSKLSEKFIDQDPFDRLMISQAITNNLTVITDDNKFKSYPVQLL